MAEVTRLPGQGCRHHTSGRCLYQEHLNPGYSTSSRCRVLLRWEVAFDDFLERTEQFGVSQQAVPDLWERKFNRMAREAFQCDRYVHCEEADIPACFHAHDDLCRQELPECEGRCRHYTVHSSEE